MNDSLAGSLYFSLQRLRGGVSREQVEFARQLLERPWSDIRRHCFEQIAARHPSHGSAPDWLATQPLVDRSELVPRMRKLIAEPGRARIEQRKTSGSTGTPFRFVKDVRMTAWMDAGMWAAYSWHGVTPGERQARFWGAPLTFTAAAKRTALDWVQNRRRLSAFRIDRANSVAFLRRLHSFRPRYAYGYPTLIDEFTMHCAAQGLDGRALRLKVVICTGELLFPAARARIADFFGCRVVNEYGCSESGVLAVECEKGVMHVTPAAAWPEIVTSDGSASPAGVAGEVVVTDLHGSVEPLLRYRLHDRAAITPAVKCACGRELPSLSVQEGRIDSFITTPSRGRVYDAVLAYTVPPEVFRFRARQVSLDALEVEVVPGKGFDPQRTPDECRQRWQEALGPGMRVTVTTVSEIALTAGGKLRYFVPLGAEAQAAVAAPSQALGGDSNRPTTTHNSDA